MQKSICGRFLAHGPFAKARHGEGKACREGERCAGEDGEEARRGGGSVGRECIQKAGDHIAAVAIRISEPERRIRNKNPRYDQQQVKAHRQKRLGEEHGDEPHGGSGREHGEK